jgi:hypothetical protein
MDKFITYHKDSFFRIADLCIKGDICGEFNLRLNSNKLSSCDLYYRGYGEEENELYPYMFMFYNVSLDEKIRNLDFVYSRRGNFRDKKYYIPKSSYDIISFTVTKSKNCKYRVKDVITFDVDKFSSELDFDKIAKRCLNGELKGVFFSGKGEHYDSSYLKLNDDKSVFKYHFQETCFTEKGKFYNRLKECDRDIVLFIETESEDAIKFYKDKVKINKNQIVINVPNGKKVSNINNDDNKIVIKWEDKVTTYHDVYQTLTENEVVINENNRKYNNYNHYNFFQKVNAIRKLINIRNYFGKPIGKFGYYIVKTENNEFNIYEQVVKHNHGFRVLFNTKEDAQKALNMLNNNERDLIVQEW